jgi:hypothetical protein
MDWSGCGAGCCAERLVQQAANATTASRDLKTMDSPLKKITSLSGKSGPAQPPREWADKFCQTINGDSRDRPAFRVE